MKILMLIIALLLLTTTVSAEIVYSQEFYDNQNESIRDSTGQMTWGEGAILHAQWNTNILLQKQNELLQEHNNLTKVNNEIMRRIYDVLIHTTTFGGWYPDPKARVGYPPLDV
jgi:hypothetical protein